MPTTSVVVYRKRRNVELALLLFAVALGVGAWVIMSLNRDNALPDHLIPVGVGWLVLALFCHILVRWRLPYADPVILPAVFVLNGLGLVMIRRLDLAAGPTVDDASRQLLWTVLGVAIFAAVILLLRDHRPLQGFTYSLFLLGILLLMLPIVPGIGVEEYGARIWIRIAGFSFQPSEIAKVVLTIAFSSYLVEKRDALALAGRRFLGIDLPRARDLGPIVIMWLASMLVLVSQKDLGTSLLFFGLFVVMLYVSTERPGWAILGAVMFLAGAVTVWALAQAGVSQFDHILVRINSWLDPFSDFDRNSQVINAQFGLAWGGLLGAGLGLGQPWRISVVKSDMISAAIGEELGIVGLMAVIVLYGLIVARGLRMALAAKEDFGKLLATGLSFVFALQVFIIIGGVTRLLPLTGLTTPFMSQGGSSLVANWAIVGLLLVISYQGRRPIAVTTDSPSFSGDTTQIITRAPRAEVAR